MRVYWISDVLKMDDEYEYDFAYECRVGILYIFFFVEFIYLKKKKLKN